MTPANTPAKPPPADPSVSGWVRRAGGVRWFIRRFGVAQLFLKPVRLVMAPLIMPMLRERSVEYRGASLPLVYARHNVTWANERCVELALARALMAGVPPERLLEVGNVTPHYFRGGHLVVDKYEPGSLKVDIVDFAPAERFDLILSISTFEHIAFDEPGTTPALEEVAAKVAAALDRCRGLLAPGGLLAITVPLGYNPALDAMIANDELAWDRATWFKRFPRRRWRQVPRSEAVRCRYGSPHAFANGILLAEWDSSARPASGPGT